MYQKFRRWVNTHTHKKGMCTPGSGFNSSVAFCYIKRMLNVLNLPLWMDKKRCVIYSEKGCWLKRNLRSHWKFSPNKCIYVNLCTLLQGHRPFWGPGTRLGLRHVALHIPRRISRLTRPPIPAYSISLTESGGTQTKPPKPGPTEREQKHHASETGFSLICPWKKEHPSLWLLLSNAADRDSSTLPGPRRVAHKTST